MGVNPVLGTVTQVDPATGDVLRTLEIEGIPRAGDDRRRLGLDRRRTRPRRGAGERVAGIEALPRNVCEPVLCGQGEADLLVVSDLALQGGVRVTTTQMAQAIAFVMREHGFRAGRFRVAYQSCDDSLASTGLYDEAKCARTRGRTASTRTWWA